MEVRKYKRLTELIVQEQAVERLSNVQVQRYRPWSTIFVYYSFEMLF